MAGNINKSLNSQPCETLSWNWPMSKNEWSTHIDQQERERGMEREWMDKLSGCKD